MRGAKRRSRGTTRLQQGNGEGSRQDYGKVLHAGLPRIIVGH